MDKTKLVIGFLIVSVGVLLLGFYGAYGENIVMELTLLPIKTTKLELNQDNSYSFNGYIENTGNVNCKAVLLTEGVEWNYTNKSIHVNDIHCIKFTVRDVPDKLIILIGEKRF